MEKTIERYCLGAEELYSVEFEDCMGCDVKGKCLSIIEEGMMLVTGPSEPSEAVEVAETSEVPETVKAPAKLRANNPLKTNWDEIVMVVIKGRHKKIGGVQEAIKPYCPTGHKKPGDWVYHSARKIITSLSDHGLVAWSGDYKEDLMWK